MPRFRYRARGEGAELLQGELVADSQAGAVARLLQQGIEPVAVEAVGEGVRLLPAGRIRLRDVAMFTRQLADLLAAGMLVTKALELLASSQDIHRRFRSVIEDIHRQVQDGRAFSEAIANYPDVFSLFYISAARSGELGGFLDQVLQTLADALEKQDEVRSKLRRAMAYPTFMAAMGSVSLVVMFIFVVPTLSDLFTDLNQTLPLPTRILIGVGNFISAFWWAILGVVVGTGLGLRTAWQSPTYGLKLDALMLRLPVLGDVVRKVACARFLTVLSALLSADVSVPDAIRAAQVSLKNRVLFYEIDRIYDAVCSGTSLGKSFENGAFPPLLGSMLSAGEASNRLGDAMARLAKTYDREIDNALGLVSSLLEPVLIVVLGSIVGLMVAAMLLPIFEADLTVF